MLGVGSYLYAQCASSWRAPSVIDYCYSSKGKVFFGPSARSLRPCRNINLLFQQINIARGYCWGPSASEGPQKRDLTMFSKYASRYLRNQESGCGYTEAWSRRSLTRMVITTKDKMITKLCADKLRHDSRKGEPT